MINLPDYKKIHCIGIGGIGLSAVAEILMARGYDISGSDMKESDMTAKLARDGARIHIGHNAENVEGKDLVIYSSAISMENPELARATELGIPTVTRAQALGALMEEYDSSIAISGTHGKTTTTSMVSLILKNAQKEPTILVGGNLPEINGNVYVGRQERLLHYGGLRIHGQLSEPEAENRDHSQHRFGSSGLFQGCGSYCQIL